MNIEMSTTKTEGVIWEENASIEPEKKSESNGKSDGCGTTTNINDLRENEPLIDTTKISGIYKIVNKVNGKYYVGSSVNICGNRRGTRWKRHIWDLNRNKHGNDYLQRAWNKHGKNVFEFVLIEICLPHNLLSLEQKYLDIAKNEQHKCKENGDRKSNVWKAFV